MQFLAVLKNHIAKQLLLLLFGQLWLLSIPTSGHTGATVFNGSGYFHDAVK